MTIVGGVWDAVESALQDVVLGLDHVAASLPLVDGWSWGVAVVALTIACRVLLLPTLLLQIRFLRRMDEVAPELERIKQRHRVDLRAATGDPVGATRTWVRSEAEQDTLLKERGVRWYVGLLPALVQIPVVVAVLRVLASDERTSDLTPASWSFVPPPTTSFLHSDQGRPLLGVLSVLVVVLVHVGQRRSLAVNPDPPGPTGRRLRLVAFPPLAGLLALNLGLAIVVSLLTSLLWGLGQSTWLAARRRGDPARPAPAEVAG